LLGRRYDAGDIERRIREIRANDSLMMYARMRGTVTGLQPSQWLAESREEALESVYTDEVMNAVEAARRAGTDQVETIDLSEEYLQQAGELAQLRAALASQRLAGILAADL
jgi:hypothetical protein